MIIVFSHDTFHHALLPEIILFKSVVHDAVKHDVVV